MTRKMIPAGPRPSGALHVHVSKPFSRVTEADEGFLRARQFDGGELRLFVFVHRALMVYVKVRIAAVQSVFALGKLQARQKCAAGSCIAKLTTVSHAPIQCHRWSVGFIGVSLLAILVARAPCVYPISFSSARCALLTVRLPLSCEHVRVRNCCGLCAWKRMLGRKLLVYVGATQHPARVPIIWTCRPRYGRSLPGSRVCFSAACTLQESAVRSPLRWQCATLLESRIR